MHRHIKKLQENRYIQTVSYFDIGFFYVLFYVSKDRGLGVHHLSMHFSPVRQSIVSLNIPMICCFY